MSGRVFLDSNILVYAATGREAYPEKFRRARAIVAHENIGISLQVIGEFVNNVRKSKIRQIVESALVLQRRYKIGYWDSQIIAAAERFDAEILYSEDLSHTQNYGAVRCENPFRNN